MNSRSLLAAAALTTAALLASCGSGRSAGEGDAAPLATTAPTPAPRAPTAPLTPPAPTTTSSVGGQPALALGPVTVRSGAITDLPAAPPPPVRIGAERIGLDVAVVPVAIKPGTIAELDVPDVRTAGWYRLGSVPGEDGSAVIVGHVDGEGRRGVFWDLRKLEPGDRVTVTSADGALSAFTVVERRQMAKQDLPPDLFRRTGPASLALVTCGGDFDRRAGHYRDNVVVIAVPA